MCNAKDQKWEDIPSWVKFRAVDESGILIWYSHKPRKVRKSSRHNGEWSSNKTWAYVGYYAESTQHCPEWEDTLEERPEGILGS